MKIFMKLMNRNKESVVKTRPNGSTRSEDYTQMTDFNQNEYNDFI